MKWVALIRGINVGGNHIIKMADLVAAFESADATGVATYIASGNVVFTHAARSAAPLATKLTAAIAKRAGFAPRVVVRTVVELDAAIAGVPFANADPDHLHLAFAHAAVDAKALTVVPDHAPERFEVSVSHVYLHLPTGLGRSKLVGSLLRVAPFADATVRNWRTVLAVQNLAQKRTGG